MAWIIYWSGFTVMLVLGIIYNEREAHAGRGTIPLPAIILLCVIWPLIVVASIIGLYLKSRTSERPPQ